MTLLLQADLSPSSATVTSPSLSLPLIILQIFSVEVIFSGECLAQVHTGDTMDPTSSSSSQPDTPAGVSEAGSTTRSALHHHNTFLRHNRALQQSTACTVQVIIITITRSYTMLVFVPVLLTHLLFFRVTHHCHGSMWNKNHNILSINTSHTS